MSYNTLTKTYYNDVNESFMIYKNNNYKNLFITQCFELLLTIIHDKTDEEFDDFYIKHLSHFRLKRPYFIEKYSFCLEDCYFDSFNNASDLIDKCCFIIDVEDFYKEINIFLSSYIQI
jgi:hypothetical protein